MKKLSLFSVCILYTISMHSRINRFPYDERPEAYRTRSFCAYNQNFNAANYNIENEINGDEINIADYAAQFTKTLPHDQTSGVANDVGQQSYKTLLQALKDGDQDTYNAIVRSTPDAIKLANPQASAAWALIGHDSSLIPFPLAPNLDSRWGACDLAEVLLMAICRDVKLEDYGTGQGTDLDPNDGQSITAKAAAVLTAYGADYKGPTVDGVVTPAVLFRGTTSGCLVGPYVSQLLWQDLHYVNQPLVPIKRLLPIASTKEFGVTWDDFVAIEDGFIPVPYGPDDFNGLRYPIDGRNLGTGVHYDLPTDYCMQCFNVLLNNGFPFAQNLPYYNGTTPNEDAFGTFGGPDVVAAIGSVSKLAVLHAWAHKWRAARRLRPEAMAGLAHRVMVSGQNPYGLNADLFATLGGVNVMDWTLQRNSAQQPGNPEYQTYLLGLMYPEGSPTHPSYPAAHAVVAGAVSTLVKAFMDDQVLIKDYMTPRKPNPADPTELIPLVGEGEDQMTVNGELEKLASNIALSRNFAGVHYRSDGDYGIALGEAVAIYFLMDWAATYMEQSFAGFELTKRDDTRIRITANGVTTIG